jgi:hypothetical protein
MVSMSGLIGKMAMAVLVVVTSGCGEFERSNPLDPASGQEVNTGELLIGSWSREDAEKNEVYTFKSNGSVELRDYSAPDGGEVDRNASFPQTLEIRYSGTYTVVGNLLRISFSQAQVNDPGGSPPLLPPSDKVISIVVGFDQLILEERDGDRIYERL